MNKYQGQYRIESNRAQWWDYGWNGAYFITICTKNRDHFFGEIVDGKMNLSRTGVIVDLLWHEIRNHSEYAKLDAFVVMPNHIHGILIIDKPNNGEIGMDGRDAINRVSTPSPSPQSQSKPSPFKKMGGFAGTKNPMINENISRIVRWYKGRCSYEIRKIRADFGWQPRFHDHIIRNNYEHNRIRNYIINNPGNWDSDKFNGKKDDEH